MFYLVTINYIFTKRYNYNAKFEYLLNHKNTKLCIVF